MQLCFWLWSLTQRWVNNKVSWSRKRKRKRTCYKLKKKCNRLVEFRINSNPQIHNLKFVAWISMTNVTHKWTQFRHLVSLALIVINSCTRVFFILDWQFRLTSSINKLKADWFHPHSIVMMAEVVPLWFQGIIITIFCVYLLASLFTVCVSDFSNMKRYLGRVCILILCILEVSLAIVALIHYENGTWVTYTHTYTDTE